MAFTMPKLFKIAVAGAAETRSRTRLTARRHEILVDEPPDRHGDDRAASPLETMLSSLLACTNVVANIVAEERGVVIRDMKLALTGHFDTRGVMGVEDVTKPFPRIDMEVVLDTNASDADIQALKAAVAARCPIAVILRRAGTEIADVWRKP